MKKYLAIAALIVLGVTGFAFTNCTMVGSSPKEETIDGKSDKVKQMDKAMFKSEIFDYDVAKTWEYKGEKPAVIDLYADWCAPCRMLTPILKDLASEYDGKVTFYKVNVDKEKELASLFQVSSIPLVVFIPKEGPMKPVVGVQKKADYKKIIDEFLLAE